MKDWAAAPGVQKVRLPATAVCTMAVSATAARHTIENVRFTGINLQMQGFAMPIRAGLYVLHIKYASRALRLLK